MKRATSPAGKTSSAKAKARTPATRSTTSRSAAKAPPATTSKPSTKHIRGQSTPKTQLAAHAPPDTSGSGGDSVSKQSQVIALLRSSTGASMAQMIELTGWLPHTVRAMISTALRRRLGLNVELKVRDGVRVYRILEVAGQ